MASSTDTCMRSEHFQSPAKDQCHPLDAPALQGVRWAFSILFPFWLGWEESTSTGDESWLDFGRHWCPAGLLSALIVCAAAHAHSARVALGEDEEKDPGWNVDWPRALGSWPEPKSVFGESSGRAIDSI
ncbi:unnamed protein product [Durusdinium trenchii]|uniref:Uncharacterized protein n=1 Tax=Durusdinium trenchii TaxID=1381693 RepID=A0ABP0RDL0_9DINO